MQKSLWRCELENQTQNKTLISLHNNIMVFIKVVKRVHPIECALYVLVI